MRINFTPQSLRYSTINSGRAPKSGATARKPAEPSFCGYFLDPEKYTPGQHDSFCYFFEHLEEGEKPKRGQSLYGADKNLVYNKNITYFFRDDIDWKELGEFLAEKFKGEKRVNTMVYACSSGLEAYAFSALIQKMCPGDCKKFFPVIAKDISEAQIEQNKAKQNGDVKISLVEAQKASEILSFGVSDDFYEFIAKNDNNNYVVTRKTKLPVMFEAANILDDLNSVDSNAPTIFACRNMWPYVNSEEYQAFSDELYGRLAKGSVVIIGDFDYTGAEIQHDLCIANTLVRSGFKPALYASGYMPGKCCVFEKG